VHGHHRDWDPNSECTRPLAGAKLKQEFSQGSGLATLLPAYFEDRIGDDELKQARKEHPFLRSKEELHYFRRFRRHYPSDSAARTVGQWPYL
jgi:hypothetical protein